VTYKSITPSVPYFVPGGGLLLPDCDSHGYEVGRDGHRNILVDYEDWDELSEEQQRLRGNRGAAVALLDRLRFHLEMMDDNVELKDEVDTIRRALNDIVEPLSMI
jgi:hypothetical protein